MKNHGQSTTSSNDANCVNYAGFASMTSSCYSKVYENRTIGEWIIDTGATAHMCNDLSLFSNHRTLNRPSVVTLPDGSMKNITKIGTVPLNQNMQLLDVLYMLTFKYNLLSVSQITQTNKISVQFYHNQCILQDLVTKYLLAVGRMHQGLYRLNKGSFSHQGSRIKTIGTSLASQRLQGNYEVWHRRLGHASKNKLLHLNVIKANECDSHVCTICPSAKQQQLSFNKSKITSTSQFELIHVDLWGPYSVVSVSNARYVLTIVDDYTRATWTYLLQHKQSVSAVLKEFIAMVNNQFHKSVKNLRSDNGTEFVNQDCNKWLKEKGIIHQKSCPYTPQQNGVVERKHKHLLQVARALMFQSKLPKRFWGESILTATYIINRLPSPVLNWETPYASLHKEKPNLNFLKTFGCLCFATNTLPHKTKFEERAFKGVFLGYIPGMKAYKIYALDLNKTIVSRDVIFHEDIFPFRSQPDTHDPHKIVLPNTIPEPNSSPTMPIPPHTDINPPHESLRITEETEQYTENSATEDRRETSTEDEGETPDNLEPAPELSEEGASTHTRRSTRLPTRPRWLNDFVATSICPLILVRSPTTPQVILLISTPVLPLNPFLPLII